MTSVDPQSTTGYPRFSLRTLILTIAALQVLLAVCFWNASIGVPFAIAALGGLLTVTGVRARRREMVVFGVFLVVTAIGSFAVNALIVHAWVGSHELEVHVLVVDASTLAPVSAALVEVLNGPHSSIEGLPPDVERDFEKLIPPRGPGDLKTDGHGTVRLKHKFFAAGQDGLFGNSGYVDTRRVWLRVTVDGYRTTYMPIDGQSTRPRELDDESPIFVTIPVGKE